MLLIMIITLFASCVLLWVILTFLLVVIFVIVSVGFYRKNFGFDDEEDFEEQLQVCITQAF
jgi:hypothetical protein